MKRAFIFDMDGTMVDNMMVHHRAWQRKLVELGLDLTLEEVRQSIHGINEEILERLFGNRYTPEDRRRIAWEKEAEYRKIFLPELKLVSGLGAFLQSAYRAGIRMGIGTAAPPENVQFVLEHLHLGALFGSVIDASQVEKGKPDPEVFLKVAEELGVISEHCIVFEDSPTGAEAALRAGMQVVIISTTHSEEEFKYFEHIITVAPDFTEISLEKLTI